MIMNKRITLWERYVLSKLMLVATLFILGGNLAMAEEVNISFENGIPDGWTAANHKIENNELTGTSNWTTFTLTSNRTIEFEEGQKIVISARGKGPSAKVKYYTSSSTTFSSTANKEFTTDIRKDTENYYELTIDIAISHTSYIKFDGYYASIKKIEIKGAGSNTVIFDENNPSEFTSKTYQEASVKYTSYKGWNTICMPFQLRTYSVNYLNSLFGTGWSAYTLSAYSNGILTFSKIAASGYIQANTPLLVEAPNATGTQVELNLTNLAVTHSDNPQASAGGATFQGTYAPIDMEGKYGVTGNGTIQKGGAGSNMPGYRAYFTGVSAPADGARPTIVFSEEEMPTGIGAVQLLENTKDVYNLNGQKVAQTRKGIYIVNGRKIVVK